MEKIKKENGSVIKLFIAHPNHFDKTGSLFIYDASIGMWCLKEEYDKLNIEEDNLAALPMLNHENLDVFGIWKPVVI